MECKIVQTISHCSCYVRKSKEDNFELHHIEGEKYFDFTSFANDWDNFVEYLIISLAINSCKEKENYEKAGFISTNLYCNIIYFNTEKSVYSVLKNALCKQHINCRVINLKKYLKNKKILINGETSFNLNNIILSINEQKNLYITSQEHKKNIDFIDLLNGSSEIVTEKAKEEKTSNVSSEWRSSCITRIDTSSTFKYQNQKYLGYVHYLLDSSIIVRDNSNTITVLFDKAKMDTSFKLNDPVSIHISNQSIATIKKV